MSTAVKQCNCKGGPAADYQDKVYGKGNRLHNEMTKNKAFKCTVCGNIKK